MEQLQKCDISASRVSSAVSSRAPSPSPSLMNIMYPGLKPGACGVQAGTPTALLRSLGAPSGNLFQPIRSNSISNLSLSAVNAGGLQLAAPLALNIPEDRVVGCHRVNTTYADVGCQTEPCGNVEEVERNSSIRCVVAGRTTSTASGSTSSGLGLDEDITTQSLFTNMGLAHQRSRSNEIDYSSARIPATTTTGSPGSYVNLRAFRPVSADSFPTAMPGGKDPGSKNGTSDSSRTLTPNSEVDTLRTKGHIARVSSEGQPASSIHWSREFATASDYFASDEVTDC